MATQPSISNLAARNACDEITALLDAGAGPGKVRIYDGPQPADVDSPPDVSSAVLAELTLSDPAFGAAVDSGSDAVATGNPVTDDSSADESGTASWFRCVNSSGVAVLDGSVGTVDADMIVDSTTIAIGQRVQIVSFKYHHREV